MRRPSIVATSQMYLKSNEPIN